MKKQSKSRKTSLNSTMNAQLAKALRQVSNQEAFRFYENIDRPTGDTAASMQEFLGKIQTVKMETIIFHSNRNDFKNWVEKTLGDSKLATNLAKMSGTSDDKLRMKMCSAIKRRLKELENTSDTTRMKSNSTLTSMI